MCRRRQRASWTSCGTSSSRAGNRRLAALLLTLLWGSGACLGLAPDRVASEAEQTAYQEALSTLSTQSELGAQELESFLSTWPRSPLADDAAD